MELKKIKKIFEVLFFGFSIIGFLWSLLEILEYYYSEEEFLKCIQGSIWNLIIPGIIGMVFKIILEIIKVFHLNIRMDDIKICVGVGNILSKSSGMIVVGVNQQLKTRREEVAKTSIHRQLIDRVGEDKVEEAFERGKNNVQNGRKYFQSEIKGQEILFLCMSDLYEDGIAQTTKSLLNQALKDLFWGQGNIRVKNERVYFPLLGTGESGLQCSKHDTIKLIIKNFIDFQKELDRESILKIKKMHVVVYWKDIFEIDWVELNEWLENIKKYCWNCRN